MINGVGLRLTAWSTYQATDGNWGEAATETAADGATIYMSALTGAEVGTLIPVPVVGTAVGVAVGGLVGMGPTSVTNNAIDGLWHGKLLVALTTRGTSRWCIRQGDSVGTLIVGLVVLAAAGAHSLLILRKLWRDSRYANRMIDSFSRLPYGPGVHRGAVRGSAMLTAMLTSLSVFFITAGIYELRGTPEHDPAGRVAFAALFVFLTCFVIHLSIIWFNFPRSLALPSMRSDMGTVTAWIHRRRVHSRKKLSK